MRYTLENRESSPRTAHVTHKTGRREPLMNYKKLLAMLMALGLVAAACGGSDETAADDTATDDTADGTATDDAADDTAADDAADDTAADDGGTPGEVLTDFGVDGTVIRVGVNGDLSGPFSALVNEIVAAQEVYWEMVNEAGGIEGYTVEVVKLDSGYATDKGIANYQELAQESEEGVLMISENTGSPITNSIFEDAIDDNMLVIPLSWASLWPDPAYSNILEKNITYCAESINGIEWLKDKVEADGKEAKLAIISRPGEYGEDGHVGAEIAAEALGIEIVYNGKGEVAGDDRTAVISQLVGSGATMVWNTLTPGELADVFGGAVSQGLTADWSGNNPSFSYPALLPTDLAPLFDQYYWQSGYGVPFREGGSAGMATMVAEMEARRPNDPLSDSFVAGWQEGIIVETIIRQAIANGDLTRAGMVAASQEVDEFDFQGLAPNQTYNGAYDDIIVRESYIYDVDASAFDLQPLSTGEGSSGLKIVDGPYTSPTLESYEFGGPCI